MANFTTNQTLNLFVAKAVKKITNPTVDPETIVTTVGDIAIGGIPNGAGLVPEDFYFVYRNGDDKLVRSDLVKVKNVEYVAVTTAAKLKTPLTKVTLVVNDDITFNAVTGSLLGQHVQVTVTLREYIGLDYSESFPIVAEIIGTASNVDTKEHFYAAMKAALDEAIASYKITPFSVSSSAAGLVITEVAQPYVWGKFEGTPLHFDVSAAVYGSSPYDYDAFTWCDEPVRSATGTFVANSGNNKIADLERFSFGESGDYLRETVWPNDYAPVRVMDEATRKGTDFGMLTIQFFYAGNSEDVQKSPKTIHVAATDANITALKTLIDSVLAGNSIS